MARIYDRVLTTITAQASAAITAGTLSTGAVTLIDLASGGNADGAEWLDVYLDVTAAPTADATAEVYLQGYDGTNYVDGPDESFGEYALTVSVPSGFTGQLRVGVLWSLPEKLYLKVKAVDAGFTASLSAVPHYPSDT